MLHDISPITVNNTQGIDLEIFLQTPNLPGEGSTPATHSSFGTHIGGLMSISTRQATHMRTLIK
jgi:hypothetical protein